MSARPKTTDPSGHLVSVLRELEAEARGLPADSVPDLLGALERVRAIGQQRMLALAQAGPAEQEDRLLMATEAAERLGMTKDYLYRTADRYPFTVRVSRGQLRFSAKGIEAFIRSRRGRR